MRTRTHLGHPEVDAGAHNADGLPFGETEAVDEELPGVEVRVGEGLVQIGAELGLADVTAEGEDGKMQGACMLSQRCTAESRLEPHVC